MPNLRAAQHLLGRYRKDRNRRHRSAVGVGDRDLTLPRLVQLRQHAGSHTTLPWREPDSNHRSRLQKRAEHRLGIRQSR